ncbi:MAG: hypothetical protein GQ570_11005 [Helicobacteraceae bacterium]|nr:hypothetical protein [Helicobacteraceae bacterium]
MKINLEVLDSLLVYGTTAIEELNTKELVPKMVTRRRLTRAAKIAIYLADQISLKSERIVYGSSFGEIPAIATILNSLSSKEQISPTVFQNSVYNTAISYLSMLNSNKGEIMTISSGDSTSLNILKAGAIKALDGDTLALIATETLNVENIEQVNSCVDFLEVGVALKVRVTTKEATHKLSSSNSQKFPSSLIEMINIAKDKAQVVEITL